jgi:beta-1,4-mannosyl-glycoprotein beta-1,4-N-acetylglucosaminyltransferase
MTKTISVIIPTFNHLEDCLKPCLNSIADYTNKENVEVLVVANGCTDGTRGFVESLGEPFKLVWFDEPLGYTKAVNEGIKIATGEYIVLMNNDTILLSQATDTWLHMLLAPFVFEDTGITGPMQAYSPEANENFLIFFLVAMKKSLFDRFGLLDEIYSPGFGEDTEFCVNVARAGLKLVQVPDYNTHYPEMNFMVGGFPIYHKGEGTFANWPGGEELLAKNRKILTERLRKPVKLNLGAGGQVLDGYTSVDLYDKRAQVQCDIRHLKDYSDNSVNEILNVHVIEHLSPHDVMPALAEWFRVLKPGGKLIIECPDIKKLCEGFINGDKGARYHMLNCIYGTGTLGEPSFTPHLYGWYDETLSDHLGWAGFADIKVLPPQFEHWGHNIRVEAQKPFGDIHPTGFFSDENAIAYRELLNLLPENSKICEVGVWKGRSLSMVSDVIRNKKLQVTAVDHFKGTPNEYDDHLVKAARDADIKMQFLDNMANAQIIEQLRMIPRSSEEAAAIVPDNSLDLVFLDADHSYDGFTKDLQLWFPKVKSGGIIAGHDFAEHFGVPQGVREKFGNNFSVKNDCWSVVKKARIFDCFPFFNELELLEVRLNELDSVVDYFILVESTTSHSGQKKPLYFNDNKEKFEKFLHKIRHVIVDDMPVFTQNTSDEVWARERFQRDSILRALPDLRDDDVLVISDADEIPRAEVVKNFRIGEGIKYLELALHYYYLNCRGASWDQAKIVSGAKLKELQLPCNVRYTQCDMIPNAGWHFSYLGGISRIIQKIENWAHQEYNTDDVKNRKNIEDAIAQGMDLFHRGDKYTFVDIGDTYPKYIVANKERYIEQGLIKTP